MTVKIKANPTFGGKGADGRRSIRRQPIAAPSAAKVEPKTSPVSHFGFRRRLFRNSPQREYGIATVVVATAENIKCGKYIHAKKAQPCFRMLQFIPTWTIPRSCCSAVAAAAVECRSVRSIRDKCSSRSSVTIIPFSINLFRLPFGGSPRVKREEDEDLPLVLYYPKATNRQATYRRKVVASYTHTPVEV